MSGLATRLYRGEAGIDVVGKRKMWFGIAGAIFLVAILSFVLRPFNFGIEFRGGAELIIPASVGTLQEAREAVEDAGAEVVSAQQVKGATSSSYLIRVGLDEADGAGELLALKNDVAERFDIPPAQVSDNQVSAARGEQVIQQAIISLLIFIAVVVTYLVFRFEWRMAVAAVASLILDLVLTAGVYSLVGFQVTPSTVIGFLTILGFALYDVVVVFDKVQENTRGITASTTTYPEAANLAVNQTLMRSINTGLVALLPVGGLLFIGAGLLGAGTLKDLGLVLFIGMGAAVYSSIFFATPVLVELKTREPRYQAHTQRVLARRAAGVKEPGKPAAGAKGRPAPAKAGAAKAATATLDRDAAEDATTEVGALAGSGPRPGARPGGGRPAQNKRGGGRGGRPGGKKR